MRHQTFSGISGRGFGRFLLSTTAATGFAARFFTEPHLSDIQRAVSFFSISAAGGFADNGIRQSRLGAVLASDFSFSDDLKGLIADGERGIIHVHFADRPVKSIRTGLFCSCRSIGAGTLGEREGWKEESRRQQGAAAESSNNLFHGLLIIGI